MKEQHKLKMVIDYEAGKIRAQRAADLFAKLNQREAVRRYLEGLLLPMERNKTLTGLANNEPIVGAQHASAQKLQWFLSESSWALLK